MQKLMLLGLGVTCVGVAVGIGTWLAPAASLTYGVKFGFIVLAILLFFFGVTLIVIACFPLKPKLQIRFIPGDSNYFESIQHTEGSMPIVTVRVAIVSDKQETCRIRLKKLSPPMGRPFHEQAPFRFRYNSTRDWAVCAPKIPEFVDLLEYRHRPTRSLKLLFQGSEVPLHAVLAGTLHLEAIGQESGTIEERMLQFQIDAGRGLLPTLLPKARFTISRYYDLIMKRIPKF